MEQTGQPKFKHKAFSYRTRMEWTGGRAGLLHGEGKPDMRVTSPPEFRGETGFWTPEDLLVASLEACTLSTFVALAERAKIHVASYECRAEGELEFVDDGYQFTTITLRPTVVVADPEAVARARQILDDAHHACFVARSLKTKIIIEPDVATGG